MLLETEVRNNKITGKFYVFSSKEDYSVKTLCALVFPGSFQNIFAEIISVDNF